MTDGFYLFQISRGAGFQRTDLSLCQQKNAQK